MIYYILFIHYLADFVFQPQKWAQNKSSSLKALMAHIGTYTAILMVALLPFMGVVAFKFAVINGIAHLATDGVTSRLASRFYKAGMISAFWRTVGFDQFLHIAVLYATLQALWAHLI